MTLVLILVGYSTYIFIIIRSGMNPPIDENNPETWTKMISYLKREQYGVKSLKDQLFNREAPFWEYQINFMYNRYFAWQFIGKGVEKIGRGFIKEVISFRGLYGIPFFIGMIGLVHHFFKDWKRALANMVLFILTGVAIVVYLNQNDPQPRERDYVYVGSFFAFSLWVGIGTAAVLEWVEEILTNREGLKRVVFSGVLLVLFTAIPLNMFLFAFDEHDRKGNYVAWDYSYNFLQTCEKNAIIFTNGDNDTFPLWYLQEVEGIRKDVRIVNLSLLNTNWYIEQLKHREPKVTISLTDAQITNIRPIRFEKKEIVIPVPDEIYNKKIDDWFIDEYVEIPEQFQDAIRKSEGKNYSSFPDKISFMVSPTIGDVGLRVQDIMVLHIIQANKWRKPVYFAVTVAGNNKLGGLKDYMRMDGLAYLIVPFKNSGLSSPSLYKNLLVNYRYRNLDDPDVFYNDNVQSLLQNYRTAFIQLAENYRSKSNNLARIDDPDAKKESKHFQEKAVFILDKKFEYIPMETIKFTNDNFLLYMAKFYKDLKETEKYNRLVDHFIKLSDSSPDKLLNLAGILIQWNEYDRAGSVLKSTMNYDKANRTKIFNMLNFTFDRRKNYKEASNFYAEWLEKTPGDADIKKFLEKYQELVKTASSKSD